jgi:hypothetical protein
MYPPDANSDAALYDDRPPYADRVTPSVAAVALVSLVPPALVVAASFPVYTLVLSSVAVLAATLRA